MITVPLILPFFLLGAVALGSIFTVAGIAGAFSDPKKNKLGVLGMQGAGKTRFLSFLRSKPFIEGQTSRSDYEEFTYQLSNRKKVYIKSGVDIGGGEMYRDDYNKIINESDVILYFFDINNYLSGNDYISYQRGCNSRFEHIYDMWKKSKKPILVIATHKDKCSFPENEMKQEFDNLVQGKSYKEMLKEVEYVDLTNPLEIKRLANKIFNNK